MYNIRWWRIFNPIETINNGKKFINHALSLCEQSMLLATQTSHLHCPSKWIACIFQLANEALQLQQRDWIIKEIAPTPSIIFMSFGLMSNCGDQLFTDEELLQDYIAPWVGWDPNQSIVGNLIQMVIGCNLTFWCWYQNHKINQDQILKVSSML
jgi:hypothetical protein